MEYSKSVISKDAEAKPPVSAPKEADKKAAGAGDATKAGAETPAKAAEPAKSVDPKAKPANTKPAEAPKTAPTKK